MCYVIVALRTCMVMGTHQIAANVRTVRRFWDDVTRYTSSFASSDKQFVDELAYVMVTLHRTGN